MSTPDPFITQRATEIQDAVINGDTEHAADLATHLLAEGGPQSWSQAADALNHQK